MLQCAILQFVGDPRLQLEKFHLCVLLEIIIFLDFHF